MSRLIRWQHRNAPVLIAFGDPEWFSYQSPWRINRASYYMDFHHLFSEWLLQQKSHRWKKAGDTMKKEIHFVVPENNSIVWEKSKILNRVVWTEHKILPVRRMPDLICMSNILQKNPAGSLLPFSKDLCDLDRITHFSRSHDEGTNFQTVGYGDVWTIAL